ncbi:MAG TPA: hypothetical protein VMY34_03705 [Acidimicrobiales bacterium]|nr:hypothetical protein [Acidimicrobiales bacterium]
MKEVDAAGLKIRLWFEDALSAGAAPPRFDRVIAALVEAATCAGWLARGEAEVLVGSLLTAVSLRGQGDPLLALGSGPSWPEHTPIGARMGVPGALATIPLIGGGHLAATLTMAFEYPDRVDVWWVERSGRFEPSRMPEVDAAAIVVRGATGPCSKMSTGWRGNRAMGIVRIPGASLGGSIWRDGDVDIRLDRPPAVVETVGRRAATADDVVLVGVMALMSPEGSVEAMTSGLWAQDLVMLAEGLSALIGFDVAQFVNEHAAARFGLLETGLPGEGLRADLPLATPLPTAVPVSIHTMEVDASTTLVRLLLEAPTPLPVGVAVLGGRDGRGNRYLNVQRWMAGARYGFKVWGFSATMVPGLPQELGPLDLDFLSQGIVTTIRVPTGEAVML